MKHLLLLLLFLGITFGRSHAQIEVIPYPQQVELSSGEYSLKNTPVYYTTEIEHEAQYLKKQLEKFQLKATLKKRKQEGKGISLQLDPNIQGKEAYRLIISPRSITIQASTPTGIFYGIQTLLQQIHSRKPEKTLNCCQISDTPRFGWRGYMLDESRHFFGKEKVKQLLDLMAWYKLNKFHWHLTDEPGWRIEIKKYPKLTTIGGRGNWSDPNCPDVNYYTQEDIREILQYAAERHVEVIPEIDMPGHATAANNAYPEYSGGGTPDHPDFTFNVGKEEVYSYLSDILREVAGLFPTKYMHIGGDEVAFGSKAWETDPHVQNLMKRENLKTVKDAERYFMYRITDTIKTINKTLIGWDELLELNMDPQTTVIMWWRHDRVNALKKALANRFQVILCPRRPLYFDFIQHSSHKWGRTWNGFCPIEDIYNFPDQGLSQWQIPVDQYPLIQGIQANLWTERVHNEKRLDFMTFPRICALAESGWTQASNKDLENFKNRLNNAYELFDQLGLYYFDTRNPEQHPEPAGPTRKKREIPMDFRD